MLDQLQGLHSSYMLTVPLPLSFSGRVWRLLAPKPEQTSKVGETNDQLKITCVMRIVQFDG